MRFFLDANMPRLALSVFARFGHEAVLARDIGLGSASDDDIAAPARSTGSVLLTRDLDFADIHPADRARDRLVGCPHAPEVGAFEVAAARAGVGYHTALQPFSRRCRARQASSIASEHFNETCPRAPCRQIETEKCDQETEHEHQREAAGTVFYGYFP